MTAREILNLDPPPINDEGMLFCLSALVDEMEDSLEEVRRGNTHLAWEQSQREMISSVYRLMVAFRARHRAAEAAEERARVLNMTDEGGLGQGSSSQKRKREED